MALDEPEAPEDALSVHVRDYVRLNPHARAAFSEDDAEALREASTFARWIDDTYRPQFERLPDGVNATLWAPDLLAVRQAAMQLSLEAAASRHLGEGLGELDDVGVRRVRDCVHACLREKHEKAQALPPLRGCEASTRLLHEEAELCQQVMQFLEVFMSDYSKARYINPQAKFDAFERRLQAQLSEWSQRVEEATAGVDEQKERIDTNYAAALQSTKDKLEAGALELETLTKAYNVAKDHGEKAVSSATAVKTPPPPTTNGKAYHAKLVQILQGRKLASLTADEKKVAQPLLKQVAEEWQKVLVQAEQRLGRLKQMVEHHRDQHRHAVKQADTAKKADALLPRAQAQLSLMQQRKKRFEALAQLFKGHRRTLRSKHVT